MKVLALLLIAGALSLYGSAFLEIWTPPGLEKFPTYKVALKHTPWPSADGEMPKSKFIAVAGDQQFRPHGVVSDWGNVPVFDLPRTPQKEHQVESAAGPATQTSNPQPARRATASANSSPRSQAVAGRPSGSSYRGTGSGTMTSAQRYGKSRSGTASTPRRSARTPRTRTSPRSYRAPATSARARSIARMRTRIQRR